MENRKRPRFPTGRASLALTPLTHRTQTPPPNINHYVSDTPVLMAGFEVSTNGRIWGVHRGMKALDMALLRRRPTTGLLHHTDQGSPYASEDYMKLLAGRGIECSMSRRGNCHDNAAMEAFFSTLKFEVGERFETAGHAKREVFDYIECFYNQKRRHSTVGQISPAEFERRARTTQVA